MDSAIAALGSVEGSEVESRVWFSREPVMRNEAGFKYMLKFISREFLNSTRVRRFQSDLYRRL